MTDSIRVKMIAHPRDTESGQRFVVREASLNSVDVNAMTDDEFAKWATEEAESLAGKKLDWGDAP